MFPQSQIQRTLNDAASQRRIAEIVAQEQFFSRSALGRRVCREFGFVDARGRLQLAGWLKALNVIAAQCEQIRLPPKQRPPVRSSPILYCGPVPQPEAVPDSVGAIHSLSVPLVAGRPHRRICSNSR